MVEVFPWNDNFATGIAIIDEQHKRLVQLLNLLANHSAYQSDVPMLNTIFNELANYAVYHFQTEESIWRQYLEEDEWEVEHRNVHNRFMTEIMALKAEENIKPFDNVIEDVLSFLTHWLAFHILESDKRMAKTVLAIQSGMPLLNAKQKADHQMTGAMAVLIDTILSMYDSLSSRTLQLMREITERQKTEAKLRLAVNAFDNTLDAICITDANFSVIEVNPSFYQVTAYSEAEIVGKNLCLSKSGLLDKKITPEFWEALKQSGHWSGIINNRRKSGEIEAEWLTLSVVRDDESLITNYVAVFSNVSHLIEQQHILERIAHHDALTGLPNRLLLPYRLELAIAHAERTQTVLAVCYLDLNGFKPVNDQLGHAAGDYLLQEIARRFLNVMRDNDTVARLGGDEFVILMGELKNESDYAVLLERILKEVARPVQIEDKIARVSASIGVTLFPIDSSEPELLLHHADQAMYQAKQEGKSRYCLYDDCCAIS